MRRSCAGATASRRATSAYERGTFARGGGAGHRLGSADAGLGIEPRRAPAGWSSRPCCRNATTSCVSRKRSTRSPSRRCGACCRGAGSGRLAELPGYAPWKSGEVLSLKAQLPWWSCRRRGNLRREPACRRALRRAGAEAHREALVPLGQRGAGARMLHPRTRHERPPRSTRLAEDAVGLHLRLRRPGVGPGGSRRTGATCPRSIRARRPSGNRGARPGWRRSPIRPRSAGGARTSARASAPTSSRASPPASRPCAWACRTWSAAPRRWPLRSAPRGADRGGLRVRPRAPASPNPAGCHSSCRS